MLQHKRFCNACPTLLYNKLVRAGQRYCASCRGNPTLRTEVLVAESLVPRIVHPPSGMDDQTIAKGCDVTKRRRADLEWIGADRVVKFGIDEDSHTGRGYTVQCEMGKVDDHFQAYQAQGRAMVPVFFVKFNPDAYDGGHAPFQARIDAMVARVNELLTMDVSEYTCLMPHVEFHYYHSKAAGRIAAFKANDDKFVCL